MKNNPFSWVNDLDQQLLCCREEIEKALFKKDMGISQNIQKVKQGYQKKQRLLCDPKLQNKLNKSNPTNPLTERKIDIIREKIIEAKTIDHPKLQYLTNRLSQELVNICSKEKTTLKERARVLKKSENRYKRKQYFVLIKSFLDQYENNFRELIELANRLAQKEGFSDFCEAKFFTEELRRSDLEKLLHKIEKETAPAWKKILKRIQKITGVKNLKYYDLYYGINKLSDEKNLLTKKNFFPSLSKTTEALGINLKQLPIKITKVVNAPPGGVYTPSLSKKGSEREITITIDPQAGWNAYSFLFHEFGHAIYYIFSPSSFLLTDSHLYREIMAEMWVGFIEQPEWLILNNVTKNFKQAQKTIEAKSIWDIFQVRSQLLETKFELALYSYPQGDFRKVWHKLSLDILGINDTSGIYSEFVFTHPLDIKNYLFAWETKKKFIVFYQKNYPQIFNHSSIIKLLSKKLYVPGAAFPWPEKISFLY